MSVASLPRRAAALMIGLCCAGGALAQPPLMLPQPFIYPNRGQNDQQLQFDKGQCYTWAVQQSGYDPANPPPPSAPPPMQAQPQSDQMAKGLFGGAILGGVLGSISGNGGEGAAIGALFGGIRSAHMQQQQQQQAQQQQVAYADQQGAIQAQGRGNYQRAFGACMGGRGYTVN